MDKRNREPVIVVGHRNPDNDSICSAVAYAHLKRLLDPETGYVAMRLGPLPHESRYVLDRLGIPYPPVVTHVHSRVRDAMTPRPLQVPTGTTMREAGETLKRRQIRTLIVHDDEGRYAGIIDTTTFAHLYLAELDNGEADAQTRRATLAQPVGAFLSTDVVVLEADDLLNEAREAVLASTLRQAVVLDDEQRALGIVTRTDLARSPRRRVILVDHNETSQAVSGIQEADVVEVVDHHRIGDIQTAAPIPFINLPLGSTASIVATEYLRHGVAFEPPMAAILLAALLTDTVLLRSPTTTKRDHELAALLADAAGLAVETYGRELFEARFAQQDGSVEGIVRADAKVFTRGDSSFMVSQYETVDRGDILEKQGEIRQLLRRIVEEQGHEFALLLVTDIMREGSQFIVAGNPRTVEHSFNVSFGAQGSVWVPGILSRKKQVAPRLLD